MNNEKLVRPFEIPEEYKEQAREEIGLTRPFEYEDQTPKTKLYLILKYYNSGDDGAEDYKDFEFFTGTTQELYDHLKLEITTEDNLDIMRSRVLVDSPKITIAHKFTIFAFMKNAYDNGKVKNNTSFDIMDYYYETDNEEA